jgi:hypothetical protein
VEWQAQGFSVKLVAMNVFENDDGNNYNYLGSTLSYTSHNTLGEGNYRITLGATSSEFLDPSETQTHSLRGVTLSLDQEFGENIGGFLRIGWQDQDAAVDFGALYSGGLTIAGRYWNRPNDSVGLGYAYLSGGNTGIDKTQVFEGYYSLAMGRYLTLTGDVQYMNEELDTTKGPEGWILGLRAVAQF